MEMCHAIQKIDSLDLLEAIVFYNRKIKPSQLSNLFLKNNSIS